MNSRRSKLRGTILVKKRYRKEIKRLQFIEEVTTLFYSPEPRSYSRAEYLYEKRRDLVNEQQGTLYCFLKPEVIEIPLTTGIKKAVNAKAELAAWREEYHLDREAYEEDEFNNENEHIDEIQHLFEDFPCNDEFTHVFKKFRFLREFIRRIKRHGCLDKCRKLISRDEKAAEALIDYIEKDSIFLESVESDDFDGVSAISSTMLNELVSFIDIPEDEEELYERWSAYFTFLMNPQSEFMRLKKFWEEYYLKLLNACALQAIIDNRIDVLKRLIRRKPVKSCCNHPAFMMNPYVRVDYYFSKRGTNLEDMPDRGRALLLSINLNNLDMVRLLVKNGISIESSSCAGNMKSLIWEIKESDENKEETIDLDTDEFDVDAYIERKQARDKPKRDYNDSQSEGSVHSNFFDENSFDSDEEEDYIMNEYEDYQDDNDNEEESIIIELKTEFSRINAISCAVNANDVQMLDFVMKHEINPFQNSDIAIRSISLNIFLKLIGESEYTINDIHLCQTAEQLISRAESLLIQRSKTIKGNISKSKRYKTTNIRMNGSFLPWQQVHSIIISQIFLELFDNKFNFREKLDDFLDKYTQYFVKNSPKGRTIKSTQRALQKFNHGTLTSMSGSVDGSDYSESKSILSEGFRNTFTSTSRRLSRTSRRFKTYSKRKVRTIGRKSIGPDAIYNFDDEALGNESLTIRGTLYKYKNPHEEYYLRIVLSLDYMLDQERLSNLPSVRYLEVIFYVLQATQLLLNNTRMKKILLKLMLAIEQDRYGADKLLFNCIKHNQVVQTFLCVKSKLKILSVTELQHCIQSNKYNTILSLNNENEHSAKVGVRVFFKILLKIGILEKYELLDNILRQPDLELKRKVVILLFNKLKDEHPDSAQIVAKNFHKYFE